MRRVLQWCGLGVGLAVLGAGCVDDWYNTPGLLNRRNHPLEVTVRVANECSAGVDLSDPNNYGPPVHRRLLARDMVALRTLKSLQGDWNLSDDPDDTCKAVWLELPGHYEAVLVWTTWHGWDRDGDPYDSALVVEGTQDDVVVTVPDGMMELDPPAL